MAGTRLGGVGPGGFRVGGANTTHAREGTDAGGGRGLRDAREVDAEAPCADRATDAGLPRGGTPRRRRRRPRRGPSGGRRRARVVVAPRTAAPGGARVPLRGDGRRRGGGRGGAGDVRAGGASVPRACERTRDGDAGGGTSVRRTRRRRGRRPRRGPSGDVRTGGRTPARGHARVGVVLVAQVRAGTEAGTGGAD